MKHHHDLRIQDAISELRAVLATTKESNTRSRVQHALTLIEQRPSTVHGQDEMPIRPLIMKPRGLGFSAIALEMQKRAQERAAEAGNTDGIDS